MQPKIKRTCRIYGYVVRTHRNPPSKMTAGFDDLKPLLQNLGDFNRGGSFVVSIQNEIQYFRPVFLCITTTIKVGGNCGILQYADSEVLQGQIKSYIERLHAGPRIGKKCIDDNFVF